MSTAILERAANARKQLSEVKTNFENNKFLKETYLETVRTAELSKQVTAKEIELTSKSIETLRSITDNRNRDAKGVIKDLISNALDVVYPNNRYEFFLVETSGSKGIRVELIDKITNKARLPKKNNGNSIKQIISTLSTVALIDIADSSRIVIFDETLSGLARSFCPRFGDVLTAIAKNNGFQFFIMNHNETLFNSEDFEVIHMTLDNFEDGVYVSKVTSGIKGIAV
jgi:hypothetical protein